MQELLFAESQNLVRILTISSENRMDCSFIVGNKINFKKILLDSELGLWKIMENYLFNNSRHLVKYILSNSTDANEKYYKIKDLNRCIEAIESVMYLEKTNNDSLVEQLKEMKIKKKNISNSDLYEKFTYLYEFVRNKGKVNGKKYTSQK